MEKEIQFIPMENMGRPSDGGNYSLLKFRLIIDTGRIGPTDRIQTSVASTGPSRGPLGSLPPSHSMTHKVQRILHIVTEIGCKHYTNWGPLTRTFNPRDFDAVPIAQLTRAQRSALEDIARTSDARVPNGEWNCQNWVMEVLSRGVAAGLLSAAERDAAITVAQQPKR
ncbi:hypothetical protein C8R43DRAFT_51727 [Mycena crocata]|nr:hypothetical protein C8R43DRAFT_51727 [Mycena crocata]